MIKIFNLKHNLKGNIALTLVILISGILLFGGMAVLITSIDLTTTSKTSSNTILAELRVKSCEDESLYKLKTNTAYTGTVTVTYSDGTCTLVITNGTGSLKNLAITSTIGTYSYQITKSVDTSTSPYTIQ